MLAAGKLADFVILDHDLFKIAPDRIKDVKAMLTVVGGRVTHALREFGVRFTLLRKRCCVRTAIPPFYELPPEPASRLRSAHQKTHM